MRISIISPTGSGSLATSRTSFGDRRDASRGQRQAVDDGGGEAGVAARPATSCSFARDDVAGALDQGVGDGVEGLVLDGGRQCARAAGRRVFAAWPLVWSSFAVVVIRLGSVGAALPLAVVVRG